MQPFCGLYAGLMIHPASCTLSIMQKGFLGIDAGTQGLSVMLADERMRVIATGAGGYAMVSGLGEGDYEQRPADWERALHEAMVALRAECRAIGHSWKIQAIGISGQMHGEVLADDQGRALGSARLWCDARNEAEGAELTERLGVKMPKRITAARWLWTQRHQPDKAARVAHITTPGGWLAYRLTGEWTLGIGDASGMFPIDPQTLDYDKDRLRSYDALTPADLPRLSDLSPRVRQAGDDAGVLTAEAAQWLDLEAGIPVAPAEGDQPAALAGSLIGDAGMVSVSLGTSVCANAVGDRAFEGVHAAIDHFCAADGKPINMVWLRNGTTFMNAVVEMFGGVLGGHREAGFGAVIPLVLEAPADCGGLLALPFMDDEPGLGVSRGGAAMLYGLNATNATPGNAAKAALLATLFNLRVGLDELKRQGFPVSELVLSGGLVRDASLSQIVADALTTPAFVLHSAIEGSAWGAALLAKYRWLNISGEAPEWSAFLQDHAADAPQRFMPGVGARPVYDQAYTRYLRLLNVWPTLADAMDDTGKANS